MGTHDGGMGSSPAAGPSGLKTEAGHALVRLVVVEDDPGVRDYLTDLLTDEGYDVVAVESALGAVARIRQVQPSAILLDLGLPYLSGASLLSQLAQDRTTAGTPIIVVSAHHEILPPGRRALVAAIVPKPIDPEVLLDAVRRACFANRASH
jgi:CheY-like chemotaxis protein